MQAEAQFNTLITLLIEQTKSGTLEWEWITRVRDDGVRDIQFTTYLKNDTEILVGPGVYVDGVSIGVTNDLYDVLYQASAQQRAARRLTSIKQALKGLE